MDWLKSEIQSSDPIQAGNRRLTVRSHNIQLRVPFVKNGLVWNRPYSVMVEDNQGQAVSLPVVDITRIAQIVIIAASLLAVLLIRRNVK